MPEDLPWFDRLQVSCHADRVVPGGSFVAIRGAQHNGVDFIPRALEKGVKTVVVQSGEVLPRQTSCLIAQYGARLQLVDDVRAALGELASAAYDFPVKKLKIVAVTGTKGKSTTVFLLEYILRSLGVKTALVSTVYNSINGVALPPTGMTTPLPDYLHAFFAQCVEQGVEWVVCEAAAQAFSMQRFAGVNFDAAIFTNFSREHGEFYASLDDYFAAKEKIIAHLGVGAPLFLNQDDTAVMRLAAKYENCTLFSRDSRFFAPNLIGVFNEYNITAAARCAEQLFGFSCEEINRALGSFAGVPGRLNRYVLKNGAQVVIDYAHNPSSYEAVLGALRPLTQDLIVVFGCGGDRDTSKRPVMGQIAAKFADTLVVTSDNPRSEDPAIIAQDVLRGIPEGVDVVCLLDRRLAIEHAIAVRAQSGSMVVLLGKGPEEYQLIHGVKHYFSEKEIVQGFCA